MQQRRVTLKHLMFLTDDFGIWQHTAGRKINKQFGYALDDSARALVLADIINDAKLRSIYQNFIKKAFAGNLITGFFGHTRLSKLKPPSEDSIGESYWEATHSNDVELISKIELLLPDLQSIRGKSYAILGAVKNGNAEIAGKFAREIVFRYETTKSKKWLWPEKYLTYANAIIPYALLSYAAKYNDCFRQSLEMLDFLNKETKYRNIPVAIGNVGWYKRGGRRALYHQQPIDPAYQVLANISAYKITKDIKYLSEAKNYYWWFWGHNLAKKPLINPDDSCADAICPWGIQKNRGAESIVCFLLAQEAIWKYL